MTDATDPVTPVATEENKSKLGKLKLAFLYVLIGGLVISALISVVAILIGEFNDIVQKAIATTISLVVHSSIVLLVILADRTNQLGKAIVPTTFVVTVIASMVTSALGLWGVWGDDLSWRMVNVYALAIGIAFIIDGLMRLRLKTQLMQVLPYVTIGLFALLGLVLIPWILFFDATWVTDVYYRIIGATAILAVTSLVVTAIVNRISIAQKPELAKTTTPIPAYTSGMMAIIITVGVFTAFFWLYGFGAFVAGAASYEPQNSTAPAYDQYNKDSQYERYE